MKTILIDSAANFLREKLNESFPEVHVIGAYTEGSAGLEAVLEQRSDIVLLNLDLPDTGGMALLERFAQESVAVIAVSEWATFAYEAMQYGAVAFVLVPYQDDDLRKAFQRAARRVEEKNALTKKG